MHEYWGPENILNQATEWFCPKKFKLADLSYNLLVPDLYRGNLVEDFKRSQNYILTTKPDVMGAMEDVKSTVKFAKDKLKATKVGIVGLSMGGVLKHHFCKRLWRCALVCT
ncbi:hypothetical protein MHBO_003169 [Bonamia ostreae]|uniref:Dienelactone hydrolase domain-containing protein n=1 Tax=Bonamia ostreae TaxID=126728 RepID=A0ABV2AQA9_9EUKA